MILIVSGNKELHGSNEQTIKQKKILPSERILTGLIRFSSCFGK